MGSGRDAKTSLQTTVKAAQLDTICRLPLPQVLIQSTGNFLSKIFHRFLIKFSSTSHLREKGISKTLLLSHRRCESIPDLTSLGFCCLILAEVLAGLSDLHPAGRKRLRMAVNEAQHKIANLLKTL